MQSFLLHGFRGRLGRQKTYHATPSRLHQLGLGAERAAVPRVPGSSRHHIVKPPFACLNVWVACSLPHSLTAPASPIGLVVVMLHAIVGPVSVVCISTSQDPRPTPSQLLCNWLLHPKSHRVSSGFNARRTNLAPGLLFNHTERDVAASVRTLRPLHCQNC